MKAYIRTKILIFFYLLGIINNYKTRNGYIIMEIPITLSNVDILYTSTYEIPMQTPIVDYDREFIIHESNKLNKMKIKNGLLGIYKEDNTLFSDFKYNHEIIPLNYIDYQYFFTKDFNLYIFDYGNLKWKSRFSINFAQLKSNLYYSENIDISDPDHDVLAVYNIKNNLIYAIKNIKYQRQYEIITSQNMEKNIAQALIHCYYKSSERHGPYSLQYILLIGIDKSGQINIWNIGGSYSFLDYFSSNRLIKNFKFEEFRFLTGGRIAEAINYYGYEKNLLLVNNNRLILINLQDLEIKVNTKINFYGTCLLMFREYSKQGLIGTSDGYIYLFTVYNDYISINDKYEICPNTIVKSISYNKTSPTDLEMTYLFIVNCGYYKIIQVKNRKEISEL